MSEDMALLRSSAPNGQGQGTLETIEVTYDTDIQARLVGASDFFCDLLRMSNSLLLQVSDSATNF